MRYGIVTRLLNSISVCTLVNRPSFLSTMSIALTKPEPSLWIERYGDELYRFALGRVSDEGCAEELVQETVLSALTALDSFRGESSERTWLFLILRRKVIDHYRRQVRHPEVSLSVVTPNGPTESDFFRVEDGHWHEAQYPTSWQSADGASGGGSRILKRRVLHRRPTIRRG